MYGLPKQTDLSFLANLELIQVCIGIYQVILHFDKETSISLECEYQVNGKTKDLIGLVSLLGQHIIDVTIQDEKGEIVLKFSQEGVLVFRDSNLNYESYQIMGQGKALIV